MQFSVTRGDSARAARPAAQDDSVEHAAALAAAAGLRVVSKLRSGLVVEGDAHEAAALDAGLSGWCVEPLLMSDEGTAFEGIVAHIARDKAR